MKKYIIIVLIMTMMLPVVSTAKVRIIKQGGDGIFWLERYDITDRTDENNGDILIICKGDGGLVCPTEGTSVQISNVPASFVEDMLNHAWDEVENGIHTGTYASNFTYNNKFYYRWVDWSGTGMANTTVDVHIIEQ